MFFRLEVQLFCQRLESAHRRDTSGCRLRNVAGERKRCLGERYELRLRSAQRVQAADGIAPRGGF
jgi:hypothetical protein